jgi:hypothetical protein
MRDTMKHNDRVVHVLDRLLGLTDYKTAFLWMTEFNKRFGDQKPIDMVDDDQQYHRLIAAIESLESGEPS